MPYPLIGDAELAALKAEGLRAMPDTATILRPTTTNTYAGPDVTYSPPTTQLVAPDILALKPDIAPGTTPCRLSASVLSGGNEQESAGELVGIMAYTLTVPPGTNITPADRIQVPDGDGVRIFEVASGKTVASWNMSDSWTLTEVQRG
jgi:hypothetical protein